MALNLYAPVAPVPTLTAGRSHNEVAGYEASYTVDSDPDTYWKSSTTGDSDLYLDLGEATAVDALALWIHNFEDPYYAPKAVLIYSSSDNITYTARSSATTIQSVRTSNREPVVVIPLTTQYSARYWKISFYDFDGISTTTALEISCAWLLTLYAMPHSFQKQSTTEYQHFPIKTKTRSYCVSTASTGVNRQRAIERKFVLVDQADVDTLANCYKAVRGSNRPFFMRPMLNDNAYAALQFDGPLPLDMPEFGFYEVTVKCRELGYTYTPSTSQLLLPMDLTLGLYRFRNNRNDSSINAKHLSTFGTAPTYSSQSAVEDGTISTISVPNGSYVYIIDTNFQPHAGSLSIEVWFRDAGTCCIARVAGNSTPAPITSAGYWFGTVGGKPSISVRDAAGHTVTIATTDTSRVLSSTTANHANNQWHYMCGVIDRSTQTLKMYVDGVLAKSRDISTVTGNIEQSAGTATQIGGETTLNAQLLIDELHFYKGVLSAEEIWARYSASRNNLRWDK